MESRNPILRRATEQAKVDANEPGAPGFAYDEGKAAYGAAASGATGTAAASAEQLQEMYSRSGPSAGQGVRGREVGMTLNDVIVKTGISFVVLLAGAVVGWNTAVRFPWLFIGAMFVGLGLGLANAFKKQVSPPLVLLYAAAEGVFLGGISYWFTQYAVQRGYQGNLVGQAVIGTLVAFGVMLFLYTSRIIKVNGTFMKVMIVAMASYLLIALASMVSAIFGVGGGWGFYGAGGLGIILCLLGVGLAAFSLCMDFESITQAVRYGVPERESWRMAFGLMATLIWLYLEILRLLTIINGR
jgi:uncharacterized YccA/Bax inhibitor family protein